MAESDKFPKVFKVVEPETGSMIVSLTVESQEQFDEEDAAAAGCGLALEEVTE